MADQAPPEDVQESNSGSSAGDEGTSAASMPIFPDRLRVHALAKIIGVTSKQVLAKLGELGIEARSAQSSLGRDVAQTVHTAFASPDAAASGAAASEPRLAEIDGPVAVTDAAPVVPALTETAPTETAPTETVPTETAPTETAPTRVAHSEAGLFSTSEVQPSQAATSTRSSFTSPLFLQPEAATSAPKRRRSRKAAGPAAESSEPIEVVTAPTTPVENAAPTEGAETAEVEPSKSDSARDARGGSSEDNAGDAETGRGKARDNDEVGDEPGDADSSNSSDDSEDGDDDQSQPRRRRRGRRGRGRGRGDQSSDGSNDDDSNDQDSSKSNDGSSNDSSANDGDVDNAADTSSSASADADSADEVSTDENADSESDAEDKPSGERRSRRRSRSRSGARSAENSEDDQASQTESEDGEGSSDESGTESASDDSDDDQDDNDGSSRRRRRRRRRRSAGDASSDSASSDDDPPNTVVHEREPRAKARVKDEVQGITGSTRLEAKRQRRRDGRDAGRRRPPILTESEFLARRESVDRVMVVREKSFPDQGDITQVAVLEDGVLVEHFVTSSASASMVGNVYLGRVQNVLPSMEAAFIDIGRGRNGVLYAGEVNWDAAGLGGNSRKIEQALKPGDQVLVQVSKDPVGHKGARLTTQLSLAGRYLVYVPGGSSTGISRKLPDTERKRLKEILREIVPAEAGVIIRTAAEGVSEEELARDVERLQAQWATIEEASAKAETGKGSQPQSLYEEPDLLVKVIRDLFNEDFVRLVIEGEKAWNTTSTYIETVAADMLPKLERHVSEPGRPDVFEAHRIDEQLVKALDRKVWLPSGGTLVIDRTEAMTVVDVNTGKFTGAGGNLEETVTRNNLEAAEEVVRQMRLRDIGGMIVVDFIDMVLESNRDLVLRRLTEALGRDRTRHQVSEVTSLGLVQMTRKKLGTGLVEAFSTNCEHCQGRGIIVHPFPVEAKQDDGQRSSSSRGDSGSPRKRRGRDKSDNSGGNTNAGSGSGSASQPSGEEHHDHTVDPSVKRAHPVALAMAAHHDEVVADVTPADVVEHGAAESDSTVIGAADVAAVQDGDVERASGGATAASDVAEDTASTGTAESAGATAESGTPSRRSGRSGRRKASRPASAAQPDAAVADIVVAASDSAEQSPEPDSTPPVLESSEPTAADATAADATAAEPTASERTASEPAEPEAVVVAAEPSATVSESAAPAEQSVAQAADEPVVKVRRGRRVARKAAAPTESADAAAVFVVPAHTDGVAESAAEAPVTAPAFAQVDASDVVPDVPVSKPRRRRAAARPAGPPVDV